ncbi:hypothetical protein H0H92_001403 [Tricholoma furcatifolium]|nr:hypothetical protein H0H92_001403 [Tricholoma furcatifolium]
MANTRSKAKKGSKSSRSRPRLPAHTPPSPPPAAPRPKPRRRAQAHAPTNFGADEQFISARAQIPLPEPPSASRPSTPTLVRPLGPVTPEGVQPSRRSPSPPLSPPPPSQPRIPLSLAGQDLVDDELEEILADPQADEDDQPGDDDPWQDENGLQDDDDDETQDDGPEDPATLFDNDSDVERRDRQDAAALLEPDEDEDHEAEGFKHGPLPNEAKEAMNALHKDYMREVEALAHKFNKPVSALLSFVGQALASPRYGMNGWNAFEIWYNAHGDTKKPEDLSAAEWSKVVSQKCDEYLKEKLGDQWKDPKARKHCLQTFVDWHRDLMKENPEHVKRKGGQKRAVLKAKEELMKLGAHLNHCYGIEPFGFIINVHPDEWGITHSCEWGSTALFEAVKKEVPSSFNERLTDYDAFFRTAYAKIHNQEIPDLPRPVLKGSKDGGKPTRDAERKVWISHLRNDIMDIVVKRRDFTLEEAQAKFARFPWASWPDLAVEHQLRLLDWPVDARLPQRGFNVNLPECIGHGVIKDGLRRRNDATDDYPRVVSWTQGITLPLVSSQIADQCPISEEMERTAGEVEWSTIPVVVDSTKVTRMTAARSKLYLGPVKRKKKTKGRMIPHRPTTLELEESSESSNDSNSADEDPPPPKRTKAIGSQRAPPPDAPVTRPDASLANSQAPEAFAQMRQMQEMFTLFQQQFGSMLTGANNPVAGSSS